MTAPDLSVVVPVYNNGATLDELIDRLVRVLDELHLAFELIFVDDGSLDDSWAILQRRAAADGRVRPFALTRNFGGQAALCAGFDQVRGARAVCMDADLDNRPEDIPALLAPLDQGHDLVCGVREAQQNSPWRRRLPSQLFNAYVRRRVGTTVRDIGCGMRAMQAHVVRDLTADGEARRLLTPLLLRRATSVVEVPIVCPGVRKSGGHSFLSLFAIAADFALYSARRPFLIAGLISSGAACGGFVLLVTWLLGARPWIGVMGILLLATGFLGAMIALCGEYMQRLYQLSQGARFYEIDDVPVPQSDRDDGAR